MKLPDTWFPQVSRTALAQWLAGGAALMAGVLPLAAAGDSTTVFNEIMYHEPSDEVEWIELANLMAVDMDLSGWRITGGIDFTFPNGTLITAGGRLVIANPPTAVAGALGPCSGRLANGGELLRLVNVSGRVMDDLDYRDGGRWPIGADGSGASLARRREGAAESGPEAWAASGKIGGTPGAANFPHGNQTTPGVRISEITGASEAVFRVELVNEGSAPVSLTGMRLGTFTLPELTLAPGAFTVFEEAQLGFHPADTDRLFLYGVGGTTLLDAVIVRPQGRARLGERWLVPSSATLGAANGFNLSTDVVVNEIMFRAPPLDSSAGIPAGVRSNPEEWIEIYNKGAAAVDVSGWQLDDAISFVFPAGTTVAAGGYLVVTKDVLAMQAKWPEHAAQILGNFTGRLSSSGERIELLDAAGNPADEARYLPGQWSDSGGSSLELSDARDDNDQPAAWADSDETAKSNWQTFTFVTTGAQRFGPTTWNEFRLGMLEAGECLIDDLKVRRDPAGAAVEVLQNGNFEALPSGSKWRFLGNHGSSGVMEETGTPGNHVLRLAATGPMETNHNHAESTFLNNTVLSTSATYEVSFRARWLAGTNQLNTRAYYQKLAKTWELPIPSRLGTPGAMNSRAVANAGPVLSALQHTPAIPAANTIVTVSLAATDPDGIGTATLFYRLNGATTFSTAPMLSGQGRWSAVLPAQAAGAIVQFYAGVTDSAGAASFLPAKGPDSRALVQWRDSQTSALTAHQLRLIMLTADRTFLFNNLNRLSNDRVPATLVYQGNEVFHDVGVRLQGTAAGRVRDGDQYTGYDIGFPRDHLFRGLHESIGVDRSGRTPVVRQQDEIYVRHTFNRAGIPCPVDDLCYFIAPNTVHTGTAILQMAAYGGLWVSSQYEEPEGITGTVFNWDITYDPTTTSTSGNPESLKPPVPFVHVATDLTNLGDDKEQYRGPFDIRAGKRRDDYSGLMALSKTMALTSAQLTLQAPEVLDMDEVFRCTALVNLWGIADTYYTGGLQHNIRLFVPESGKGVKFLPWDMDFTMSGATNSAIIPSGNNLGRLITSNLMHRRRYLGHVRHLCETVFRADYLSPWLTSYGKVVGQNFNGASSYITSRRTFAQTQYPAATPFAVITPAEATVSTEAADVTLEGSGWIDIREIRLAGVPLTLNWTTLTRWKVTIPLTSGVNTLALEAFGYDGTSLGTRTLAVTRTTPTAGFTVWRNLHFTPAELADPSISGPLADPTASGLGNLLRYALGLTPRTTTPLPPVRLTAAAGLLRLEFSRLKNAADLDYLPETAGNPGTWTSLTAAPVVLRDNGDGTETVQVEAAMEGKTKFLRLRVTLK